MNTRHDHARRVLDTVATIVTQRYYSGIWMRDEAGIQKEVEDRPA